MSTEFITKNGSGMCQKILWWIMGIMSVMVVGLFSSIHTRLTTLEGQMSSRGERITRLEAAIEMEKEHRQWLYREIDVLKAKSHSDRKTGPPFE